MVGEMKTSWIAWCLASLGALVVTTTARAEDPVGGTPARAGETTIPLAGTWGFRLDPEDVGAAQQWSKSNHADTETPSSSIAALRPSE